MSTFLLPLFQHGVKTLFHTGAKRSRHPVHLVVIVVPGDEVGHSGEIHVGEDTDKGRVHFDPADGPGKMSHQPFDMGVDLLREVLVLRAFGAGHQEADAVLVVDEELEDEVVERIGVKVLPALDQDFPLDLIEDGVQFVERRADQRVEQRLFVREREVERAGRHAGRGADLPKGGLFVPALQEMLLCCPQKVIDRTAVVSRFVRHRYPLLYINLINVQVGL